MRFMLTSLALLTCIPSFAATPTQCAQCAAWNEDQQPFRIFGDTYYVGTHGLSSVLITSPSGHVLIDGALPQSAPLIAAHIEQLGFKLSDIKVILNSHVHFDHAGGLSELQQRSGAKVIASDIAAQVLMSGKTTPMDPQFGHLPAIEPVAQVEALGAKKQISVGSLELTAIPTPGHTPGGTSWTWQSCEGSRCLNIVYGDSLNAISDVAFKYSGDPRYPTASADMEGSIKALSNASCDILIAPHPEATGLWNVIDRDGRGERSKLIDTSACKRYASGARERFTKRLQSEQK